jgi:hypothetical protein
VTPNAFSDRPSKRWTLICNCALPSKRCNILVEALFTGIATINAVNLPPNLLTLTYLKQSSFEFMALFEFDSFGALGN